MGIIKITSPEDLLEIQYFLRKRPRLSVFLLDLIVHHQKYQIGRIYDPAEIGGALWALYPGYGKRAIGISSWENGNVLSLEIDQELFQRIRYTNIILGGSTVEKAVCYLTTVVDRGLAHQLKNNDIKLIFENHIGLEELLPERVFSALEREGLWGSIPKESQFNLLIRKLNQSRPKEVPELISQLRSFVTHEAPVASLRKLPEKVLCIIASWDTTPVEIKMDVLLKSAVHKEATEFELKQFASLLLEPGFENYWTKIPDGILNHPLIWPIAPAEKRFHYLINLLTDGMQPNLKYGLISRLADLLADPSNFEFWQQVPDHVMAEPELWENCPTENKISLLLKWIENPPTKHTLIRYNLCVLANLMVSPEANIHWKRISPALYEEPELYAVLPPELKVPLLVKIILPLIDLKEREKRVHELAEILLQVKDLSHWIPTIPESIVLEPEIWSFWPVEEKLPILLRKIEAQPLECICRHEIIIEMADLMKLPQTQSFWNAIPPVLYTESELYAILPPNLKVPLVVNMIQIMPKSEPRGLKVEELASILAHASDPNLWRFLPDDLIFERPIMEVAPFFVKLRLFNPVVRELLVQPIKASYNNQELSDDDFLLAMKWLKSPIARQDQTFDEIRDFLEKGRLTQGQVDELSRVLSARAAELVVKRFLDELGYETEDISLLQLTNSLDDRWKKCDLQFKDLSIDVKNARATKHSKKIYVDQCVPNFKLDRKQEKIQEVRIAGVFSQMLLPKEILTPESFPISGNRTIQVLGITTYSKLLQFSKNTEFQGNLN